MSILDRRSLMYIKRSIYEHWQPGQRAYYVLALRLCMVEKQMVLEEHILVPCDNSHSMCIFSNLIYRQSDPVWVEIRSSYTPGKFNNKPSRSKAMKRSNRAFQQAKLGLTRIRRAMEAKKAKHSIIESGCRIPCEENSSFGRQVCRNMHTRNVQG